MNRQASNRARHNSSKVRAGRREALERKGYPAWGLEMLEQRRLLAAITTDQADYAFGDTANISGEGFLPEELVQLQVLHADGTPGSNQDAQNAPWQVQADAAGFVTTFWIVDDPDARGAQYVLTAVGLSSGEFAQTNFTDANITITANTLWSAITTGSGPGGQPSSADVITIQGNATLTVDVANAVVGTININPASSPNNTTATLAFNAGSVLNVTTAAAVGGNGNRMGVIDMTAGGLLKLSGSGTPLSFTSNGSLTEGTGTIEYSGSGAQTIVATTYFNFSTSTGGTKTAAGALVVDGSLSIGSSSTLDVSPSNFALTVKSAFTNDGSFNARAGTVTLNGTASQFVGGASATTFNSLLINNASGISLGNNATVNATLTLTNGNINTNANTMIIASTGTVSRTSGHIVGNLQKSVATGSSVARTFEVGTGADYTPITVTFASVTSAGTLTGSSATGDSANLSSSGLSGGKSVNRTWTLSSGGALAFTTYNAQFTFVTADRDAGTNTAAFLVRRFQSGTWFAPSSVTTAANSTTGNGFSGGFGQFAIAQLNLSPSVTRSSAIVTVNEGQSAANTGTYADSDNDGVSITASFGSVNKAGIDSGTWSWSFDSTDGPAQSQIVTIFADDGFGGISTTTFSLVVNNVAPTAALANGGAVDEGSAGSVAFSAQFDPSTDDTTAGFRYAFDFDNDGTFDLGDGTYLGSGTSDSVVVPASFLADGPASRVVRGRILDKDGGFTDYTTTITVNNVAPSLRVSGNAAVNEGSAYTLTLGSVSDPGTDTISQYIIHWGDGHISTINAADLPASRQVQHTYADGPDSYHITVDLVDEDGTFTNRANTFSVNVNNVAPSLTVSGNAAVNEGSAYTLTLGSVSDPGADTISQYIIHWGDGHISTVNAADLPASRQVLHTYADGPDSYHITVDLVDEDGTFTNRANTFSVSVNNVAPSLTVSGNAAVNEGSAYTLTLGSVSDPGADTISQYIIHWGDGNISTINAADLPASRQVQHTYADGPDSYHITVDLVDEDGTFVNRANTFSVNVNNVAPSLTVSGNAVVNEGSAYTLTLGSVSDPGTDAISQYIIHWGDGHISTINAADLPASRQVQHTYADGPDSYDITVDLVDEDGTFTDRANAFSVNVNNVAPSLTVSGNAVVNEGSAYTLTLGSVSDPGADTISQYIIHWGDGHISTVNAADLPASRQVLHTYADGPDSYHITVDLVDEDGTFTNRANTFSVSVNNVAPSLTVSGNAAVNEGSAYTLTLGSVSDPGADTISQYIIHWGDGHISTVNAADLPASRQVQHTYADGPDSYHITVDLVDEDGTFTNRANAFSVNVNNVAPSLTVSGNAAVNEGSAYTLTLGSVSDPGTDTISQYIIHWGDGNISTVNAADLPASRQVQHTYADGPDSYHITVDLVDEDGTFTNRANTFSVNVNNVAPSLTVSGNAAVNEGSAYTLTLGSVSDPGTDTISQYIIHWGDGNISTINAADLPASRQVQHTYADGPDSYHITVDLVDEDGTFVNRANTFSVSVNNVAPVATANSYLASATGLASGNVITDDTGAGVDSDVAGANDPLTVSAVNGFAANVGVTIPTAHGTVLVNADGSFTYQHGGGSSTTDSFTYTISDGDGGFATATVTINIPAAGGPSVTLIHDPADTANPSSLTALLVLGTSGNDKIEIKVHDHEVDRVVVRINERELGKFKFKGTFAQITRIIVRAGAGNDEVKLPGDKTIPAWIFGEDGDDKLWGGGNDSVLIGGAGNDELKGGAGRDLLIGGQGADKLMGQSDDDILVAGYTDWDNDYAALAAIMKEWTRTDANFLTRVAHLRGTLSGGLNGSIFFNALTVHDDDDGDPNRVLDADTLNAGSGNDWCIYKIGEDKVTGKVEATN